MSSKELYLALVFLTLVSLSLSLSLSGSYDKSHKHEDIVVARLITHKCDHKKKLIWATDGIKCYVFRTKFQFEKQNIWRQKHKLKCLRQVSRRACQKYNRRKCKPARRPICCKHGHTYRTFSSICHWQKHICKTGKFYEYVHNGKCCRRKEHKHKYNKHKCRKQKHHKCKAHKHANHEVTKIVGTNSRDNNSTKTD